MDVYVRLYWQHDLDLIALHYSPSLPKMGSLMKAALTAYVRGLPYEIHVPDQIMFDRPIKSCNANIHLYEGQDDDLIEFVKSLHYGLRSNAMKQILRNYVSHMFILPYNQDSGIHFKSKIHTNKERAQTTKKKKQPEAKPEKTETKEKTEMPKEIEDKKEEKAPKEKHTEIATENPEPVKEFPNENIENSINNDDYDFFGKIDAMM